MICLFALPLLLAGTPSASPARNAALEAELRAMAREDQTTESGGERRVDRLRFIIRQYGWPGNALVGRQGARAAWLIAQHADFDVAFQRECLNLIQQAYLEGDVDGHDLAYLTDRIAAAEGKPQVYGTQGAHAYTPEQEVAIDLRRFEMQLPSLAEFRAMVARGEYVRIHDPGW